MITCGINVKKRMLMNTHHHCGTLMRICRKNSGKNCLVIVKIRKETIWMVFRCYLVEVKNKNQK